MHSGGFFFQAFVYLLAAVVSVPIAKRLGLGSVLGYLLAGAAIGPFGIGLVGQEGADVMHFAEFGVVMMLFLVGLELRPSLLWRMRTQVLGMGGLQVGLTGLGVTGAAIALGQDPRAAIAIGMSLALSSTAYVLQTLSEKGLLRTDAGQSSFSVLLFQDVAVIPMLAVMPLLALTQPDATSAAAGQGSWVSGQPAWIATPVVLGAVLAVVGAGRYLMRPVLRYIARTGLRELFTATALLLVIATALLMTQVGLSPALGTFLAGVVLADSEFRHELEGDVEPFKGLLLGLFFIAVGSSIDFQLVADQPGPIVGLVAGLVALKLAVLVVVARIFRMGAAQGSLFAFSLAQGGEFGFVLFSFAAQEGVIPQSVAAPLIVVVALSMALSPLLLIIDERVIRARLQSATADRAADAIHHRSPVIIAGFGRFGSVVGRLLRAKGVEPTVLDLDPDNVELLRRLGLKVFYGDASRRDLLRAAGADSAEVLVLAIDDHERTLELVHTARKHFPHLSLLARATGRTESFELMEAGVEQVYRETLDTSLRMGVDVLRHLGHCAHQAVRASRTFRKHDESCQEDLIDVRHDRKAYIRRARQRIRDLEELILADQTDRELGEDAAWDPESLRAEIQAQQPRGDAPQGALPDSASGTAPSEPSVGPHPPTRPTLSST